MFGTQLLINQDELARLENILTQESLDESIKNLVQPLARYHHQFPDGVRVDVTVRTGQTDAWIEEVWFDQLGNILSTSQLAFYLDREYALLNEANEVTHSLLIQPEELI